MWAKIKSWWGSWKNSGTILWARAQVLFGAVWTVLSTTDLAPLLNPKLLTYWLIVSGVVTELIRQKNAADIRQ